MPHIKITTDGITDTRLFIDGKEVQGVTGIHFSQNYKQNAGVPILQIDLKATDVELDIKRIPELPEPFNRFYVSVEQLWNSKLISTDEKKQLCEDFGIELV